MATIVLAVCLPLKIWKRTPPGFTPIVRISALDFIQASALSRSARKAEMRRDFEEALKTWPLALANDPCNRTVAANYIRALLRSKRRADAQQALQIATWLCSFSPNAASYQLLIAAADRNHRWNLVLGARDNALNSSSVFSDVHHLVLKALFRTGRFVEAKDFLDRYAPSSSPDFGRDLYSEALDCILNSHAEPASCARLKECLQSSFPKVEAHEIYLITCAEKLELVEFQKTLDSLKRLTDETLPFDVLHVRLLLELGRWDEARRVAALFRAPRSGLETFEIADTLLAVGDRNGALEFLRGFSSEFQDSTRHLVLYAQLLLQQGDRQKLRALKLEIRKNNNSPPAVVLEAGISCFLDPAQADLNAFSSALNHLPPSRYGADLWYFGADVLVEVHRPDLACEVLSRIESQYLQNPEFYSNLFAAAEANKDATLMRRVAERRYQLAPADLRAAGNYAAMLAMCGDQPEQALALSAACLKADPKSVSAKINHAAALINSERIGSADLILRKIDESSLPAPALNQLRFIKLKRAVKVGDNREIRRLAHLIDKSVLYSVQIRWLTENRI